MKLKLAILAISIGLIGCKVTSVDSSSLQQSSGTCTDEQRRQYISQLREISETISSSFIPLYKEASPQAPSLSLTETGLSLTSNGMGTELDFSQLSDIPVVPPVPEDKSPEKSVAAQKTALSEESKSLLAGWQISMAEIKKGEEIANKLRACDNAATVVKDKEASEKLDALFGKSDTPQGSTVASNSCYCGREYVAVMNRQWNTQFCVLRQANGNRIAYNGGVEYLNHPLIVNDCAQGCSQLSTEHKATCATVQKAAVRNGTPGAANNPLQPVSAGQQQGQTVNQIQQQQPQQTYRCMNGRCGWVRR